MDFSFDVKSLTDPKKRLLLGILLLAVGVFCMIGPGRNSGFWFDRYSPSAFRSVEKKGIRTGKLSNNSNNPIDLFVRKSYACDGEGYL